jgi:hypothetical protein
LVNFNYSLQKIGYTLSLFLNAIAFSYHQGKRTVSLIREFWDTLYNRQRRQLLFLACLQLSEGSDESGVMKKNC